jgi:hypothetical protein
VKREGFFRNSTISRTSSFASSMLVVEPATSFEGDVGVGSPWCMSSAALGGRELRRVLRLAGLDVLLVRRDDAGDLRLVGPALDRRQQVGRLDGLEGAHGLQLLQRALALAQAREADAEALTVLELPLDEVLAAEALAVDVAEVQLGEVLVLRELPGPAHFPTAHVREDRHEDRQEQQEGAERAVLLLLVGGGQFGFGHRVPVSAAGPPLREPEGWDGPLEQVGPGSPRGARRNGPGTNAGSQAFVRRAPAGPFPRTGS